MKKSAPVSALRIAEVAQAAREIHRISELEQVVELGQLVVDNVYDGDMRRLRDRGASDVTLRVLAFHPELPLNAAQLYETLAVFEAIQAFGGIDACRHISASHIRAVLGLSLHEQVALLQRAEQRCWSERELDRAVAQGTGLWPQRTSPPMTRCTAPHAA